MQKKERYAQGSMGGICARGKEGYLQIDCKQEILSIQGKQNFFQHIEEMGEMW
ncbi:hypothetical protein [Filifactor villosus]|uniref:Uncharacterized protein n=1 Tax=Filifactor villosus TaxID=29374 RepID=A0ABV9QJY9_9FIRM